MVKQNGKIEHYTVDEKGLKSDDIESGASEYS